MMDVAEDVSEPTWLSVPSDSNPARQIDVLAICPPLILFLGGSHRVPANLHVLSSPVASTACGLHDVQELVSACTCLLLMLRYCVEEQGREPRLRPVEVSLASVQPSRPMEERARYPSVQSSRSCPLSSLGFYVVRLSSHSLTTCLPRSLS